MLRIAALALACAAAGLAADRPNILWITAEDHGPWMGAYGDPNARTPNVDALAARGMLYRVAWSTAPVCAPARTTLISGMYPPSFGGQHMRSLTRLPASMKMYPQYLREAGYYVTNNSKKDYNLEEPGEVWDESSNKAHWKNRPKGKPFFAIFNYTESHESRLRIRPHEKILDPAKIRVPGHHPDAPEVREDWAQHYDNIAEVDRLAGERLKEIADAGLAEDTIVFYYSDHGSGIARHKRWTYNSGLHVPWVVYFPEKWRHLAPAEYRPGGQSFRPIGFVDAAPTALSIAGIRPPSHMQGRAFAGEFAAAAPRYQFGFRDRMDERYDMSRSVRDERYIYIRNYKPHRIWGQYIDYMFQTPTTRVWKSLFDAGKLNPAQALFWQEKPAEELYDLVADPDEVDNLARRDDHKRIVERLRGALQDWQVRIRDVGFLPEGEIHSRAEGGAPYDMGHDDFRYPMRRTMETADRASSRSNDPATIAALRRAFRDADSAVRYWAGIGAIVRADSGVRAFSRELNEALADPAPYPRIAAAEALGRWGNEMESRRALAVLMELAPLDKNGLFVSLEALNAIDYMDGRAAPAKAAIAALPQETKGYDPRFSSYIPRLIERVLADLD